MLRINLIPAYIAEEKKKKGHIAGAIATFATLCAIPLIYTFGWAMPHSVAGGDPEVPGTEAKSFEGPLMKQVDDIKTAAERVTELATQKKDQEAKTAEELAKVQPIFDKRDFVNNLRYNNMLRPEIFRNVAKYTYKDVEYSSMSVNGDVLQLDAYVKNFSDIGRFYLTLFANPDIKALSFEGLQGWPNGNSGGGALSAPPGGMGGGSMGMGGSGGPPSGYAGMMGRGSSGGGMGGPPAGMMGRGGMAPGGDGMAAGGSSPFAGGASANRPGYPIKMTAQLVKPVTTPIPPSGAAAGGAGGGMGGMGMGSSGPPGGYASMMGGRGAGAATGGASKADN
jgi:hypothetical protein